MSLTEDRKELEKKILALIKKIAPLADKLRPLLNELKKLRECERCSYRGKCDFYNLDPRFYSCCY